MALFAIGDLHGCAGTLDALLDALPALGPGDTVVFLGDYVDRGPDSAGVIERLLGFEAAAAHGTGPACVFLRGNHDQMMLDYADRVGDTELWWANGGRTTLQSYHDAGFETLPAEHLDFLRRTVLWHVQGGFAFVHAGLDPSRSVADNLDDADPGVLLWTRAHLNAPLDAWEMPVVCGHTPVTEPIDLPRLLNLDTGAVFFERDGLGWLTAAVLPERRFVRVRYAG